KRDGGGERHRTQMKHGNNPRYVRVEISLIPPCWRRNCNVLLRPSAVAEKIPLAEFYPVVAEDPVGSCQMKIEVWEARMQQVLQPRHFLLAAVLRQADKAFSRAFKFLAVDAVGVGKRGADTVLQPV